VSWKQCRSRIVQFIHGVFARSVIRVRVFSSPGPALPIVVSGDPSSGHLPNARSSASTDGSAWHRIDAARTSPLVRLRAVRPCPVTACPRFAPVVAAAVQEKWSQELMAAGRNAFAVTFGRFNPVTKGHLALLTAMVAGWEVVTVCVSDLAVDAPPGFDPRRAPMPEEFYSACDEKCSLERNPFTVEERVAMWRETIRAAGLSGAATAVAIRRPEHYPQEFNDRFPADRHDLAFGNSTNEFDVAKTQHFQRLLNRAVLPVQPAFTLHATDIKRSVGRGADWSQYLPPGGYEVFAGIGGPDRLARAALTV
jgi:nicotinamide mononucleotide adenylyltransferase